MITSAHNLTEITATMVDRNPEINSWINEFLHKADGLLLSAGHLNCPIFINVAYIGIGAEKYKTLLINT